MAVQNPTTNHGWALPVPGASAGVWGQLLNEILGDDQTGIDAILAEKFPASGGTISGTVNIGNGGSLQIGGETVITSVRALQNVTTVAGIVTSGTFDEARIPSLPASKVNSGTFHEARIPSLPATRIGSGVFDEARIPVLNASKINAGTFPVGRGGTGRATLASGNLLAGAGTSAVAQISPGAAGGYLYSTGSGWVRRNVTVSTGAPSGTPADGDLHFRY